MGKTAMKKKNSVMIRMLVNTLLILAGLVAVILFMTHMQRQYSIIKANQTAVAALDTIEDTLNANTEKVETLRKRYHADNHILLSDIAYQLVSNRYATLLRASEEERTETMNWLSTSIGDERYLFVIDKTGTVLSAPRSEAVGENLVENGTLTEEQLGQLLRVGTSGNVTYKGTRRMEKMPDGTLEEDYEEVIGTPAGTEETVYFYSTPLVGRYYLIFALNTMELENQFTALRELGPVLSSVVVGDDGFIFAVDASTNRFMYYDDGKNCLSGEDIASSGMTKDILENNYSGLQTIGGVSYQCVSRTYSSSFYGEYTVITAVCAADKIFADNTVAIAVTALTFLICSAVIMFYSALLRQDPEQLANYEDKLYDRRDIYLVRRRTTEHIRNIRLYKLKGNQIFLKLGIAAKMTPVVAISAIVVLLVSWNAQTLVEISRGMSQSATAIQQMDVLFGNQESSSALIVDRFENQYLSKIKLLTFLIEDTKVIECLNDNTDDNNVHIYMDNDLNPILNSYGKPVRAMAYNSALKSLAENNRIDYLAIYDDQGRTLITNDNLWYYMLNRTEGSQSFEFLDILTGKKDSIVQKTMVDDLNRRMQYIGVAMNYYTLAGRGPEAGRFVSAAAYEEYRQAGHYVYDGIGYTVEKHRGMVQGGVEDHTISSLTDATSNQSLMSQVRVGMDGFVVLFDNSSEHVCLWSPNEATIGRTAEEMGITNAAFSGTFKGFTSVNGIKHFQMYNYVNGYWVATALPASSLLAGRNPISFITTLVSLLFFALLFMLCIFSNEEEENAIEAAIEKRFDRSDDNGMVRVLMPSGKIKYVRSASARFSDTDVRWRSMTTDQRLARVTRIVVGILSGFLVIAVLFTDQLFDSSSIVAYVINGDWEHSINYFAVLAFSGMVLCVAMVSSLLSEFINFIIRNMGARVETIGRLMLSVVKYTAVLFSIFYGLSLLGFSTAGLVTSASIMSIVVGLGSQSLISDILSGIFIVFEGAFRVGDIVTVGDFYGSVVDIGLRTTKIENFTGDIKIFNNASIAGIVNMTKKSSYALCQISIAYNEDLQRVEDILQKCLPEIGEKNPKIIGVPVYKGVAELQDSAVVLRVVANCREWDRPEVSRFINRELLMIFQKNNINIPFPQLTVSYANPEE